MSEGEFELDDWIFGLPGEQRFTQDSPVLLEVWRSYGEEPGKPQDLLLTPHKDSSAADLLAALPTKRVARKKMGLAYNDGYVVATLDFRQLVRQVVPLSHWWSLVLPPEGDRLDLWVKSVRGFDDLVPPVAQKRDRSFRPDLLAWYIALVGRIELGKAKDKAGSSKKAAIGSGSGAASRSRRWRAESPGSTSPGASPAVDRLRQPYGRTALSRSRLAVKADAAERVLRSAAGSSPGRWSTPVSTPPPGLPPSQRKRRARARSGRGPRRLLPRPRHLRLHPVAPDCLRRERRPQTRRARRDRGSDRQREGDRLGHPRAAAPRPARRHLRAAGSRSWHPRRRNRRRRLAAERQGNAVGGEPGRDLPRHQSLRHAGLRAPTATGRSSRSRRRCSSSGTSTRRSDMQVIHGANLSLSLDHDLANYAVRPHADLRRVRAPDRQRRRRRGRRRQRRPAPSTRTRPASSGTASAWWRSPTRAMPRT